jgi:ubiquinone/menaquinone biosynthesis C-methylase UbiE
VLDLSGSALEVARSRLGAKSALASWIAGDIRSVDLPEQAYDIWHDRAVLHFLTESRDRDAYVRQVISRRSPSGTSSWRRSRPTP